MFYGLSKLLKDILPKQLFYRGLLIVATPIIVLQVTISVVFFDSLWIKTNKGMTRALVSEIKTFIDAYDNDETNKDFVIILFKEHLAFNIKYEEKLLPKKIDERWFSPIDRSLRRELKSKNLDYWFDTTAYKNLVDLKVKYKDGYFQFFIPKERLTSSSARLFGLWITVPAILMIAIAIIFLKNQTRPIVNLAKAAERFGKGHYINEFRPSGASEIRKASYEFDRMVKRINRHLNQRSEMLSGISHDLRTPLTRLKLQLEMLNQKEISEKMSKDIDEMESMLNDYLQFAKTQIQEDSVKINVNEFFLNICKSINNRNLNLNRSDEELVLNGRKNSLERCFINLIQNGLTYGKKVFIGIGKTSHRIVVSIDDDGPGIPKEEYRNIFKPFYRLDKSRSLNKSGVGLGLSIAEDIVNSHGGNIQLSESKHKGLQVKVFLPF